MPETVIRDACLADAEAMASLYNHYVHRSIATFETEPVAVVCVRWAENSSAGSMSGTGSVS